ncbi:MAG: hypothetical protein QOD00_3550 [Blastocatellia bacterium]|nr:hypothetical protein [Blastocatellia bacterium]
MSDTFDERAFIQQVESANPEELATLLMRPSLNQEKALRAHLGDERYQRMHSMALRRKVSRGISDRQKGNVVVIHGIMGGELTVSSGGPGDLTWVNAFRIFRGWLDRLRLSDDGRREADSKFKVTATGIMKRYYGELLLSLAENWNVKAFWFDWRKDIDLAADELNMQINSWFGSKEPVHIVAHSMGGLVARTFINKYKERWESMWDKGDASQKRAEGTTGGRLIMLGTPNHGSFAIPQVITGIEGLVKKLTWVDVRHNKRGLLDVFNTFVGSYQMLPSPLVMPEIEKLYTSETYSRFNVSVPQIHLENARAHHTFLKDVADSQRMIYVAGFNQVTFNGINDWTRLDSIDGYKATKDGDGRVPHTLGLLSRNGSQIQTYYIEEEHGNLSTNPKILAALDELLTKGTTDDLYEQLEDAKANAKRSLAEPTPEDLMKQVKAQQEEEQIRLQISLGRMGTRSINFGDGVDPCASTNERGMEQSPTSNYVSPEERKVEETITRGFLAYRGEDEGAEERAFERDPSIEYAKIEIGLEFGKIQEIDYENIRTNKGYAIDAISVGHYIGVEPQYAERRLDEAISAALVGKKIEELNRTDLLLTQYTERGILHGRLGQPFILPDPRPPKGTGMKAGERLIAIAGMDEPGRFGMPELTVLARELCWALGRLKKFHLATVLIGSGSGNLPLRDAVAGWLSGIRRAVSGSNYDEGKQLARVTFVESDPRKVIQLNKIINDEIKRQQKNHPEFEIFYRELDEEQIEELKAEAFKAAQWELRSNWKKMADVTGDKQGVPARVTLSLDLPKKTYHFGAITDTASVPERDIVVDPPLIWQANDELAGEQRPAMQLERGRFLEELLMPTDLREVLYTQAPLVMLLDSTTARIHWEMVAQPSLGLGAATTTSESSNGANLKAFEYEDDFLGTCRGFTRQLRTVFAPPPEPPPPPQRVLRVLVVADPAADAHLPGAQEEGVMVADLFESYNLVYKDRPNTRVAVKRLFGPVEATRTNVLRELMIRPYDVLHFAGHCVYQWGGDPQLSGWIFNAKNKELLSANELNRIDRIPKFVFSNACESGITPDRSQERSDELAPSFAEAFFGRGVMNFVCTAWPVDDLAARTFALTLYAGLLGIKLDAEDAAAAAEDETNEQAASIPAHSRNKTDPLPMHDAMKLARLEIARTPNGRTTWGAYQHYGNPYFQLFFSPDKEDEPTTANQAQRGRTSNAKSSGRSTGAKKSSPKRTQKRSQKKGRKG